MDDSETASGTRQRGRGAKRGAGRAGGNAQPIDMGLLPELIGFNLRCAQVALFQHFNSSVGASAISAPQFGALLLIEANPGISQSAVAEALRFDRSTLVQIIDRLEGRELVVREVSSHDRRSHALRLTGKGATLLTELKQAAQDHEKDVARGLSDAERDQLIALLQRIHTPQD